MEGELHTRTSTMSNARLFDPQAEAESPTYDDFSRLSARDETSETLGSKPRKQTNIKRACNECRQQKLRCDVIGEPFSSCSRCRRLQLECKIDASFRRIEKRKAKSERQHLEAARLLSATMTTGTSPSLRPPSLPGEDAATGQGIPDHTNRSLPALPTAPENGQSVPEGHWASGPETFLNPTHPILLRRSLSQSSSFGQRPALRNTNMNCVNPSRTQFRKLDGIELSPDEIQELFGLFFKHYHRFLPFLDPLRSPDDYFEASRLLFWMIISIASRRYSADLTLLPSLAVSVPRLLSSILQSVPQNYHDVKALCLLNSWPFPVSGSSKEPTFMLSGTMLHIAMQIGLHRPSHAQDFSQFALKLPMEELQDRITTWSTCKIVAQSVATGYGQPPTTILDETFEYDSPNSSTHPISPDLINRLRIEKLCGRITRELNSMSYVPSKSNETQHHSCVDIFNQEISQLESDLVDQNVSTFLMLYLRCAQLHLRLYFLFDSPTSRNYSASLMSLYESCQTLLSLVLNSEEDFLSYCPNYIYQMTLAAGCSLYKIFKSPIMECINVADSKVLFNSAMLAIRKISVSNNDLPGRLAEVLAQLKARSNQTSRRNGTYDKNDWSSLQLKVRSRMSMSVTFDSLWEWRKGFEADQSRTPSDPASSEVRSGQEHDSPATAFTDLDNRASSNMQGAFDLDAMVFDDFYPMNWILDNSIDLSLVSSMPNSMPP